MTNELPLRVLGSADVRQILSKSRSQIVDVVRSAYVSYGRGQACVPHAPFVTSSDGLGERARIIALPAFLGGETNRVGIKWIASFPDNLERDLPRASALMVLNCTATGRALAVLEATEVSAYRTAASAALAAAELHENPDPRALGILGAGPINLTVARFVLDAFPGISQVSISDLRPERSRRFAATLEEDRPGLSIQLQSSAEECMRASEILSVATTATSPHIQNLSTCPDRCTILNISLRDFAPSAILAADNIVDDLHHVCRKATSIELAYDASKDTSFVRANLSDVLLGQAPPRSPGKRVSIFSPFGLGMLDVAVADYVLRECVRQGVGIDVCDFNRGDSM
ncbi:MAG: 2,3-diaminopropionate biosynthesis protein SbnB [Planctomycetota bacterium]